MGSKKISQNEQSGVVPYTIIDGKLKFLLVTTRTGKRWTIPKGNIKKGLSASESALEEAEEEAGVSGEIIKPNIGFYTYEKSGRNYRVKVFLLRVTRVEDLWPESSFRKRKWASPKKAAAVARFKRLEKILKQAKIKIRIRS